MKIASVLITYLILIHINFTPALCQNPFEDSRGSLRALVLDPSVKTVQLYREGWTMSYPVIKLMEDVPLVLEFDDLSKEQPTFMYKVIHCNADWTPSDLSELEYLEGYPENEIRDGTPSFNTYYNYLHYRLQIPNENTRLLLSGNYLLLVYRDGNPESVVFTKRFMVTESAVHIEATAKIPVLNHYKACCQEVDFTVNHSGVTIDNPYGDTRTYVFQNGLWDLGIDALQPSMIHPGQLVYDYQEENIFPGGNEFRFFDTKNTRTPTYFVQRIDFMDPYFHFELKPDKARPPPQLLFPGGYQRQVCHRGRREPGPGRGCRLCVCPLPAEYVVSHGWKSLFNRGAHQLAIR